MEKEFKVLSLKDEQKLSVEELKEYYKELRQYILKRKLTNTTPGATTIAPKLKGITNKIANMLIKLFSNENVEFVCDGKENIPDGAVIFAHSHQGILDNFVWMPNIDKHCLILHHQDVNKFLIFFQLNTGLVFVRKGDKTNNHNAKMDMIRLLLEGHSIAYFPEGTWNLSPNKLHLPLSFGFLDVAKKAQVPVVPVVHEYTYETINNKAVITKIHSKFGKPIYVFENDNLIEKLNEYEEIISTMRYELIEENGIYERSKVSNFDYINFLKDNYEKMQLGKTDVERERKYIFGGESDFYQFHNINDVPFDDNGELINTTHSDKDNEKIKALKKKYNI